MKKENSMDGIERIKTLASEIKDKPLLKIIDYLLSRKDMSEKYLNETKNLKTMIEFIKGEAKKQAINNVAMIEDDEVYSWAIHYWDEPNEKLNIKNVEKEEPDEEINEEKAQPIKKSKNKKWIAEGQLSIFDYVS